MGYKELLPLRRHGSIHCRHGSYTENIAVPDQGAVVVEASGLAGARPFLFVRERGVQGLPWAP